MNPILSQNTQAILLLTAPLIVGRSTASRDLLTPSEYKRLARHLREIKSQPSALLSNNAEELMRDCQSIVDLDRMQRLLGRGFLLSQVVEHWRSRAIWVVSRADADYPKRLKTGLKEDAPSVLYGCGDITLLETGGLAVVGSRKVDNQLIDYTMSVGQLCAKSGKTLISGGAKGIDQAAMTGAAEAGGKVCNVMAENLERAALNRDNRTLLLSHKLVLVSAYDPCAGFNVGHAMQRNKLIYALADVALVVNSDLNKGGTWAGATEQLDKLRLVPVYVRSIGDTGGALDALRKKGALPWPNPKDPIDFDELFKAVIPEDIVPNTATDKEPVKPTVAEIPLATHDTELIPFETTKADKAALSPAELLFVAVRNILEQLLIAPMNDAEVAATLNVSASQAKTWLQRLADEGVLEKLKSPVKYRLRSQGRLL